MRPGKPGILRGCAVAACSSVGNDAGGHRLQVLHLLLGLEPPYGRCLEHGLDRPFHPRFSPWPRTFEAPLVLNPSRHELFPPKVLVFRSSYLPHITPVISETATCPIHQIAELSQLPSEPRFQLKLKVVECVLALSWHFVGGRVAAIATWQQGG